MSMQHVQEEDKENNSAPVKLPHSTNLLIKGARTTDLISRNDIHQVNSDLNLKQNQKSLKTNKAKQTKYLHNLHQHTKPKPLG